jgi:hypothetical protein
MIDPPEGMMMMMADIATTCWPFTQQRIVEEVKTSQPTHTKMLPVPSKFCTGLMAL